jgi:high-affinity iron transporter
LLAAASGRGAEVSGRVNMPEVCSPEVSPAVVSLERAGGPPASEPVPGAEPGAPGTAEVMLIDQRGLQFVPRVRAMTLGQTLRFTNQDAETHNVHIGNDFNQSMSPGQAHDFVPSRPGVLRLLCDVHSHMRGFVVVSASPWVRTCSRTGSFRFEGVPDGRYTLNVWHEMGTQRRHEVVIEGDRSVRLEPLTLTITEPARVVGKSAPARRWPEVIDRIGVLLGSSIDAAGRSGEAKRARKLVEDAYWGEFEASDMETAVRNHLGFARAGELEGRFFALIREVGKVGPASSGLAGLSRALLLDLVRAADELSRKGVTDRSHVFDAPAAPEPAPPGGGGHQAQLRALKRGFGRVGALADRGEADEAASAMTEVYFHEFEALERFVALHYPQDVRPLESRFNALRGEVGSGLKGRALAERLAGLQSEVEAVLGRSEAAPAGSFGPAFAASLITIVREGVEVILILTMLITLVAKAGQAGAIRAIGWGVGLAVLASLATALGLNLAVASTQGRAREMLEGLVMLAASGVLFYVSYWLISQSESRRWMDFLKRQARRGMEPGGRGTLALTAFLAVYREGAETALMYQALIGGQDHSRPGLIGLAAGLGVGLVLLAAIALLIRATSVRLPLRAFFQVTGLVLFLMAVVFSGNGIFELQQSGLLRVTPLAWLGRGVPELGLHPNVQALSAQALLLAGAALALLLLLAEGSKSRPSRRDPADESPMGSAPKAGVGV